ncbi:MAG: hypothetical protein F4210_03970 [Holophagales bacterium]|nr:hypothetical protein [Holophagales bacterium]MYF94662.1 hypothetical protein [Holophagales bacterium]
MKLMKHITIALVLCAIPAVALGQSVSCDDCTHVMSVYYGDGGLIAEADGDMVTYVATCEGVTRTGELMPNDDGMVAMLLDHDNGLACHGDDDGNGFEIGPIMDGGWYWLTMESNSAVGGLVSMDVLENETVDIADAGEGVEMVMGKGAVLLTETATGRTGLLPNILPEMPTAAPAKCGFKGAATAASPASPVQSKCMLGDGGTILLMTSTNAITGATVRVMDKASVTRPGGTGSVTIVADLWGNGSGHYVATHADTDNGISAMRGQPSVAMGTGRAATRLTGVTYTLSLSTGGPGAGSEITSGTAVGGVDFTEADSAATITVEADSAYCSKDNNHSATVNITATMSTATDADQVVPSVARNATSGAVGSTSFTVMCPAASANPGQELVPENPFPTE